MVTIVDYGVGNLTSIFNMIKKGGNASVITNDIAGIEKATKLLLPGMGHFDNCMILLKQSRLLEAIEKKVFVERVPVLGICVGLQMFMASSEEGTQPGLNWVPGQTIKFKKDEMMGDPKIPNMGWLDVKSEKDSQLWKEMDDPRFYFAHSFHVRPERTDDVLLTAHYGYDFTVGIEFENIIGVQFHPEKSHRFGMKLLKNFAENYR